MAATLNAPWLVTANVLTGQVPSTNTVQVEDTDGRAFITVGARATRVRSSANAMLGGDLRIRLPGNYSGGLTIWTTAAATSVPGGSTGIDYSMDFAYGGAVLERPYWRGMGLTVGARATVGAGLARMTLPGVSGYTQADNFGVAEAEVYGTRAVSGSVGLRAQLGYRYAFGVDDLPQTLSRHFRGVSFTVGMAIGPW